MAVSDAQKAGSYYAGKQKNANPQNNMINHGGRLAAPMSGTDNKGVKFLETQNGFIRTDTGAKYQPDISSDRSLLGGLADFVATPFKDTGQAVSNLPATVVNPIAAPLSPKTTIGDVSNSITDNVKKGNEWATDHVFPHTPDGGGSGSSPAPADSGNSIDGPLPDSGPNPPSFADASSPTNLGGMDALRRLRALRRGFLSTITSSPWGVTSAPSLLVPAAQPGALKTSLG